MVMSLHVLALYGTYAAGKTSVAFALRQRLPDTVVITAGAFLTIGDQLRHSELPDAGVLVIDGPQTDDDEDSMDVLFGDRIVRVVLDTMVQTCFARDRQRGGSAQNLAGFIDTLQTDHALRTAAHLTAQVRSDEDVLVVETDEKSTVEVVDELLERLPALPR